MNGNQAEMLANRLRKRARHLAKWARRERIGSYRLYDRDIPEIPLVIDYYEGQRRGHFERAVSCALYRRPYEKAEADEALWLSDMKEAIARELRIDESRVFTKERRRQSGASQYGKTESGAAYEMDVREGDLLFRVNLSHYIDSGLFLDARLARRLAAKEARDKAVLNLFCYTAAFSVHAAASGAAIVDSVDLSSTNLERAKVNFELNGLLRGAKAARRAYNFIRADALSFLCGPRLGRYDIIILNPPVFSNSKMAKADLDLKRDGISLIKQALALLKPEGKLFFGSNIGLPALREFEPAGFSALEITENVRGEDFKKRRVPHWHLFSKKTVDKSRHS
ncbi:MAG: class I SAM-dependent methyltransferase [Spirochaetaceae bacterium]|jgi:23S rRNA G2069 N7-methylase RlmK/C1962 C5-methylase RlmI|nr:class I SAM-dependent methyltransferase [Spirochaetaceae bacterium]